MFPMIYHITQICTPLAVYFLSKGTLFYIKACGLLKISLLFKISLARQTKPDMLKLWQMFPMA